MTRPFPRIRRVFAALAVAALAPLTGLAQPSDVWPTRPVHVVVPFAPGGASDFVARALAPRLAAELKQPVIVDNKSGAAGNIGMEAAAGAAPDGYTVFLGNIGTLAVNPAVFGERQKVTATAFAAVTMAGMAPDVFVVNAKEPWQTVKQLVDHARSRPGTISFASPGSGSVNRLEMELLRQSAAIEMVHVPYRGGAGAAVTDVVGGQVPIMFTPIPSALQLIKGGRLRALAVASPKRLAQLPDVPTMIEAGYPQVVGGSWQAVMLPARTPPEIVARLHQAVTRVFQDEDFRKVLAAGGVEPDTSASPREFQDFIAKEALRWAVVARAAGATAD